MSLQKQVHDFYLLNSQLRGLGRRLATATRRRDAQQRQLDQLQTQRDELAAQLRHSQASATAAEKQVEEVDRKIEAHREQMNTVTNNKQYSALLVEVNTLKIEKGRLEEAALAEMNGVEEATAKLAELDAEIAERQKVLQSAEQEVEAARAEAGDRLDRVQAERDDAAAALPPEVLQNFERLDEAYDGEALAEVEEQDRRRMEYTCGGCFMSLPVEVVNKLMTRPDTVTTCTNCNRILYVDEALKDALASK